MSVLIETSAGDIVIDLFVDECPVACKNFLNLCKMKYYHGCLVYNVQPNYIIQTGDPTGTGSGGNSAFGLAQNKRIFFQDEIVKSRKFDRAGLVCMAHNKENGNSSQFFITLRGEDLDNLEGRHTVLGEVAEGMEVVDALESLYCDEDGRPFQDVRIRHTHILDDPLEDIAGLIFPPSSPTHRIPPEETVPQRIPFEEGVETEVNGRTEEEIEQSIRRKEAHSRAMVLEMTGDIPDIEAKPPAEVIFVCKLNPVTTDADLELIFSRFGTIRSCEIIRDHKTGDSLNYAFIEFDSEEACIRAYEKMNNVLIDDRRVFVDFSQSVSKLWNSYLQRPRKPGKLTGAGSGAGAGTGAGTGAGASRHVATGDSSRTSNAKEGHVNEDGSRDVLRKTNSGNPSQQRDDDRERRRDHHQHHDRTAESHREDPHREHRSHHNTGDNRQKHHRGGDERVSHGDSRRREDSDGHRRQDSSRTGSRREDDSYHRRHDRSRSRSRERRHRI